MPGAKPTSRHNTMQHPLARMLPLQREQMMVYRLGEKRPPAGELDGYGPMWEAITLALGASGTNTQTLQARVNLQRDFTLLAITCSSSSSLAGGFRAQLFDMKKKRRLADRGVIVANLAGTLGPASPGSVFLREPYVFDQPDSQILVEVTNFEAVANTVQIVLYGLVLRFNEARPGVPVFPGGSVASQWGGGWGQP